MRKNLLKDRDITQIYHISHNDLDGLMSSALVKRYARMRAIDYTGVNVSLGPQLEYHLKHMLHLDNTKNIFLIITDLSLDTNYKDIVDDIMKIHKNVLIIDHHKTSNWLVNYHPNLDVILNVDYSATLLTYCEVMSATSSNTHEPKTVYNSKSKYSIDNIAISKNSEPLDSLTYLVLCTDMYDTWKWKDLTIKDFNNDERLLNEYLSNIQILNYVANNQDFDSFISDILSFGYSVDGIDIKTFFRLMKGFLIKEELEIENFAKDALKNGMLLETEDKDVILFVEVKNRINISRVGDILLDYPKQENFKYNVICFYLHNTGSYSFRSRNGEALKMVYKLKTFNPTSTGGGHANAAGFKNENIAGAITKNLINGLMNL